MQHRITLGLFQSMGLMALTLAGLFISTVVLGLFLGPDFEPPWNWLVGTAACVVGVVQGFRKRRLAETVIGAALTVVVLFGVAFLGVPWRTDVRLGFPMQGFLYFGLGSAALAGIGFLLGRMLGRGALRRQGAR